MFSESEKYRFDINIQNEILRRPNKKSFTNEEIIDIIKLSIHQTESIQNFVKKFKGAIKEDTIKPLK